MRKRIGDIMNSRFRRDYVYVAKVTEGELNVGDKLRYIRYDRAIKAYIFLTGQFKNENENLIIVYQHIINDFQSNLNRLHCNGYEPTNDYPSNIGKLITSSKQLVTGSKYRFKVHTDAGFRITSKRNLVYTGNNIFYFDNNAGCNQLLDDTWFKSGDITARLVG